ncbi:phosducin-like protein [Zophobas morio]|uniref:phosducin-like protein n=1 Tax=Zophobas morio TaxID=2755281 RepID=UPI003083E7E9
MSHKTLEEKLLLGLEKTSDSSNNDSDQSNIESEEEKNLEPYYEEIPAVDANKGASSGPKGVLQDYRRFLHKQTIQNAKNKLKLIEEAKRFSVLKKEDEYEEPFFDDQFLNEYKLKKLSEITREIDSLKKFGTLREINISSYLEEIDGEDRKTNVVVHLYEPSIPLCRHMNTCLSLLARDFPLVKFIYIKALTVSEKFNSDVGLPAILIYRGGKLVANLVNVVDYVGMNFAIPELNQMLLKFKVISEYDLLTLKQKNQEDLTKYN